LLVTSQRPQVLSKLDITKMKQGSNYFEFALELTDLKQGRCNYRPHTVLLRQFIDNRKLCIFNYLSYYIQRTALVRKDNNRLLLTIKKPFLPASQNTITRWIKSTLNQAGIDTTTFSAGSTRAASASKAQDQGAPISQIMDMGGWSRESTFRKFYDKPLLPQPYDTRVLHM
jgi:hypothetical protein